MVSDWKSCGNCKEAQTCRVFMGCYDLNDNPVYWEPIPCPSCGGILSEVRWHNGKKYRHCYACHFEFSEGGENT